MAVLIHTEVKEVPVSHPEGSSDLGSTLNWGSQKGFGVMYDRML
jgi:hypothetical protein